MPNDKRPEWVPPCPGTEYTTKIIEGVSHVHSKMTSSPIKKKKLDASDYIRGVRECNRTILARAITLVESGANKHLKMAQKVLKELLPFTGNSIRIGITGVPGAGKSTFIESLGCYLIEKGLKLAVLTIDPSSSVTKGSILGDKTRMEKLSCEKNCFIRPSPSGGTLGGVARKTRETLLLCEAAGYNVIFIETVGVGQNEITVRAMVDFFLLIKIAGAGDELQGIKKGVIELADAIAINKADGDNIVKANLAKGEFQQALHYLKSPTENWNVPVCTCSSISHKGISEIWDMINSFHKVTKKSGFFTKRRQDQNIKWIHELLKEHLLHIFYSNSTISSMLPEIEHKVLNEELPVTTAVQNLLDTFKEVTKG